MHNIKSIRLITDSHNVSPFGGLLFLNSLTFPNLRFISLLSKNNILSVYNNGAFYRLCNLVNDSLSLPVDCRSGILCALKMIHLY